MPENVRFLVFWKALQTNQAVKLDEILNSSQMIQITNSHWEVPLVEAAWPSG